MGVADSASRPLVLVVTHNYPRHAEDQAGQFIQTLIEPISDRYRFVVVAPHTPGARQRERLDPAEVIRFRYADDAGETLAYSGDMHEQVLRSWRKRVLLLRFIRSLRQCTARALAEWRPSLVHVHWWIPCALAVGGLLATRRVPYILTTHGSDVTLLRKFRWLRPVAGRLFRRAAACTAVSTYLCELLREVLGVDAELLPMPYDDRKFRPQPEPGRVPQVVTCIGRLIERKGQAHLIRAGRILAQRGIDFQIQLVGDGPDRAALEQLAAAEGVAGRLLWTGNVPHREIPDLIASSSVVVLPSVTDWKGEVEGLGMVLAEASACGRPVVATRLGGPRDAVAHGVTGLLVEPDDPNALADALATLLGDSKMREAFGQAGIRFARERFSPRSQAEKLAALIERARRR